MEEGIPHSLQFHCLAPDTEALLYPARALGSYVQLFLLLLCEWSSVICSEVTADLEYFQRTVKAHSKTFVDVSYLNEMPSCDITFDLKIACSYINKRILNRNESNRNLIWNYQLILTRWHYQLLKWYPYLSISVINFLKSFLAWSFVGMCVKIGSFEFNVYYVILWKQEDFDCFNWNKNTYI